jgi:hypothetical protein
MTIQYRSELEYIAELVVTAKVATNHVKLNQLDASQGPEVLVVTKFLMSSPRNSQACHLTETSSV